MQKMEYYSIKITISNLQLKDTTFYGNMLLNPTEFKKIKFLPQHRLRVIAIVKTIHTNAGRYIVAMKSVQSQSLRLIFFRQIIYNGNHYTQYISVPPVPKISSQSISNSTGGNKISESLLNVIIK